MSYLQQLFNNYYGLEVCKNSIFKFNRYYHLINMSDVLFIKKETQNLRKILFTTNKIKNINKTLYCYFQKWQCWSEIWNDKIIYLQCLGFLRIWGFLKDHDVLSKILSILIWSQQFIIICVARSIPNRWGECYSRSHQGLI